MAETIHEAKKAPKKEDRIVGRYYLVRGDIVRLWGGKEFRCIHNENVRKCKPCKENPPKKELRSSRPLTPPITSNNDVKLITKVIEQTATTLKIDINGKKQVIITINSEETISIKVKTLNNQTKTNELDIKQTESKDEMDIKSDEINEQYKKEYKVLIGSAFPEVNLENREDGKLYIMKKTGYLRFWKFTGGKNRSGYYHCIHKKNVSRCKICPDGGNAECKIHLGKRRDYCPCTYCREHRQPKLTCEKCKEQLKNKLKCHLHGTYNKNDCILCEGSGICEHEHRHRTCEECGDGSGICQQHPDPKTGKKVRKERCVQCQGHEICPHGQTKFKKNCIECSPDSKDFCQDCRKRRVDQSNYKPYCFDCYRRRNPESEITRNFKFKENYIHEELTKEFKNDDVKLVRNKAIKGSKIYPDWRIDMKDYTIVIECDEHCHKGYEKDVERTEEMFEKLGKKPLVVIRFNPDKNNEGTYCFDIKNGAITPVEKIWNQRKKELIAFIRLHINEKPVSNITEECIGYD